MNKHIHAVIVIVAVLFLAACFNPVGLETEDQLEDSAPPTDLLGEWLFSGDASDSSGNDRHGTVVDGFLVADRNGNPNSAYEFTDANGDDNGDGYIRTTFPDLSPEPSDSYAISVSLWAKADWTVADLGSLFSINADSAVVEVSIESVNGTVIYITSGGSSRAPFPGHDTKLSADTWAHFALTWDGNSEAYQFYVNGTEQDSGTMMQANFDMTHLDIGRRPNVSNFIGAIDDVRVFNRVLTPSEVSNLAGE